MWFCRPTAGRACRCAAFATRTARRCFGATTRSLPVCRRDGWFWRRTSRGRGMRERNRRLRAPFWWIWMSFCRFRRLNRRSEGQIRCDDNWRYCWRHWVLGAWTEAILRPDTHPCRSLTWTGGMRALPATQEGFLHRRGTVFWYERAGWWNPKPLVTAPIALPPPNRAVPRIVVPIVTP